jgi:hypothetical protein
MDQFEGKLYVCGPGYGGRLFSHKPPFEKRRGYFSNKMLYGKSNKLQIS